MKRISYFLIVFLALSVFETIFAEERPNILVFLCDDLGYGDLGCYGNPIIQTPNLDHLAGEGIRFTDFYSTAPVCSASRAGLLTGRTPSRVGVFDWIPNNHQMHLLKTETTFATLLKKNGYDTALIGKWHCNGKFNSPDQPQPSDHGFDYWFSTQNNASPSHENPGNFVRNGVKAGKIEGFSCQIVVDEAINWLAKRSDAEQPFCLLVTFHEPHEPIASPKELVEKYRSQGATKPGEAVYYANVENMDAAVGRLVAELKRKGLWDNTLTFFTSDNGPETLDRYQGAERSHGTPGELRGMKLWIYEGGYRVPGIAVWPGKIRPNQVSKTPIGAIDFLPTFCAISETAMPTDRVYDGTNLLPFFQGGEIRRAKPLFWCYINAIGDPRVSLRDGDWKLVATIKESVRPLHGSGNTHDPEWFAQLKTAKLDRFELYNLVDDHRELTDLTESQPEKLAELKMKMESLFQEMQHDAPLWNQNP